MEDIYAYIHEVTLQNKKKKIARGRRKSMISETDLYFFLFLPLLQNWHPKPLSDGTIITNADTELQIRVTLSTNPKFVEDSDNPDCYQITLKKKRKVWCISI